MDLFNHISILLIVIVSCLIHTQAQTTSSSISPSSSVANPVDPTIDSSTTPLLDAGSATLVQTNFTPESPSTSAAQASQSSGTPGTDTSGASGETVSADGSQSDSTTGTQAESTGGVQASSSDAGEVSSSDTLPETSAALASSTDEIQPSATSPSATSEQPSSSGDAESSAGVTSSGEASSGGVSLSSTPALATSSTTSSSAQPASSSVPSATSQPSVAPSASMTTSSVVVSTPPTQPAITTQPPLPTKYPSFAGDVDIALYTLMLSFTNAAVPDFCNSSTLHNELTQKLVGTTGFVTLNDVGELKFDALYSARMVQGVPENDTIQELKNALSNKPQCYNYTDSTFQPSLATFAALTTSYCSASHICKSGYKCQLVNAKPLCTSLCEDRECQNNGVCSIVIDKEGKASSSCSCVSNYETTYSGDNCQTSRMNPERVAAIVGGVLGAVVFILLVALYCMCYRKRDSSGKKYHLSGVYNDTYDNADVNMKNL